MDLQYSDIPLLYYLNISRRVQQTNKEIEVSVHEVESMHVPIKTEWVEMSLGRSGLSRKSDTSC